MSKSNGKTTRRVRRQISLAPELHDGYKRACQQRGYKMEFVTDEIVAQRLAKWQKTEKGD